jgi:hypothetical protein
MVVNVVLAAGTWFAVLVALFGPILGPYLRAKWWPPKLNATVPDPHGEPTSYNRKDAQGNEHHEANRYFHLRVANERRWSPAMLRGGSKCWYREEPSSCPPIRGSRFATRSSIKHKCRLMFYGAGFPNSTIVPTLGERVRGSIATRPSSPISSLCS